MTSWQDARLLIVTSSNAQRQCGLDVVLYGSLSLSKSEFKYNTPVLIAKIIFWHSTPVPLLRISVDIAQMDIR